MIEAFENQWLGLIRQRAAVTREVDASSPLRMIYGLDGLGRPLFFIITETKPGMPHLGGSISVERGFRSIDNKWTLSLVLNVDGLMDVFVSLVADLAKKCAATSDERTAIQIFLQTVEEWQELLRGRFDRLSEPALRGLMAELWFGFRSDYHGYGQPDSVAAWAGPYGGEQDFMFASPEKRYEVKAVRITRDHVRVSSELQLDSTELELVAVTIDRSDDPNSCTLPQMVQEIRDSFIEPETRIDFNRAFVQLRVNLDDPWYGDQKFQFHRMRAYTVGPDFPAIRRSQLPEALSKTRYRLELSYLDSFLIADKDLADGPTGKVDA